MILYLVVYTAFPVWVVVVDGGWVLTLLALGGWRVVGSITEHHAIGTELPI